MTAEKDWFKIENIIARMIVKNSKNLYWAKKDALHDLDTILCNSIDMVERRQAKEWITQIAKELKDEKVAS